MSIAIDTGFQKATDVRTRTQNLQLVLKETFARVAGDLKQKDVFLANATDVRSNSPVINAGEVTTFAVSGGSRIGATLKRIFDDGSSKKFTAQTYPCGIYRVAHDTNYFKSGYRGPCRVDRFETTDLAVVASTYENFLTTVVPSREQRKKMGQGPDLGDM
jgi:hypothetical protein